jgi:mannosyl-oligosaccharide alpha-1,2-mannosidase
LLCALPLAEPPPSLDDAAGALHGSGFGAADPCANVAVTAAGEYGARFAARYHRSLRGAGLYSPRRGAAVTLDSAGGTLREDHPDQDPDVDTDTVVDTDVESAGAYVETRLTAFTARAAERARAKAAGRAEGRAALERLGRQRALLCKQAMAHCWTHYRQRAWGHDELKPQTGVGDDNWGGYGVTLVDALDTLWIMGMRDEFQEAVRWVEDHLDFAKGGGHAMSSVFESTIRSLGGLLAAHELSGEPVLLERARQLGDRLLPAFGTESGLPMGQVGLGGGAAGNQPWSGGQAVLSEFGTLQLEFRALSQLTGDNRYRAKADRVHALFYEKLRSGQSVDGLWPIYFSAATGAITSSQITLGALGDSFYEYLLKTWLQGGQREPRLRRLYDEAMHGVHKRLLRESHPDRLAYIAEYNGGPVAKMDHLVCFMPGLLALGAHGRPPSARRTRDIKTARALMYTCFQMYQRTATGLSPEYVTFGGDADFVVPGQVAFYLLRPEAAESLFVLHQLTGEQVYRDWGHAMMTSIHRYCRTQYGYGAFPDVRDPLGRPEDRMESFFLAETLKYLYMLQTPVEEHGISLDKYVLNTEAHPLLRRTEADGDPPGAPDDIPTNDE